MNDEKFLKPVSLNIKIDVSVQKVWEVISKPSNLELYHPFCETNPVEKWPGNNSIDYVNYYNGLKFKRIFTDWIEDQGYSLLIGKENGRKSKVIWKISKTDDLSSELEITIYPHDIIRYPNGIKQLIHLFYIKPMLRKYLASVLTGFKTYLKNGEPISKNQFGTHRWFSN